MSTGQEGYSVPAAEEADLAKAFQAIAQGEQTATQLENHLTKLEARIDELMKQANENHSDVETVNANEMTETTASGSSSDTKKE